MGFPIKIFLFPKQKSVTFALEIPERKRDFFLFV